MVLFLWLAVQDLMDTWPAEAAEWHSRLIILLSDQVQLELKHEGFTTPEDLAALLPEELLSIHSASC